MLMLVFVCAVWLAAYSSVTAGTVRIAPAPAGETLSRDYLVSVESQPTPVYVARVASGTPELRWKAMDDKARSADYFEPASFAYFDMEGPVSVTVRCPDKIIKSVKILPSSFHLPSTVTSNTISFTLRQPMPVTIEINGDWVHSLHLFANPPETHVPKPGDPHVIFFGPGIHEISHLVVTNQQTVYVSAGAIVRGVIKAEEPYQISSYSGLRTYSPTLDLRGDHITLRGRGIIDGTLSTTHARNLLHVQGEHIQLDGVILRDSSTWTIPIRRSRNVAVNNIKILGYRANSDGIDICNSQDVTVKNCFIRTLDDLVVLKTDRGQGISKHINVQNCVLWNEVAHALSIGAELSENVEDVLFTNCDIIHDKGREWTLRVYHCDAARISNVRFENLRIEESPRLISLWIDKAYWTRDSERGHIDGVVFKNISATADPLRVELHGFDAAHAVENISFDHVTVNGKPLASENIQADAFVRGVIVRP